jgi:hypothetical protein
MQNSFNELRKVTFQEEQGGVQVAISKPKQHRTMRSMV